MKVNGSPWRITGGDSSETSYEASYETRARQWFSLILRECNGQAIRCYPKFLHFEAKLRSFRSFGHIGQAFVCLIFLDWRYPMLFRIGISDELHQANPNWEFLSIPSDRERIWSRMSSPLSGYCCAISRTSGFRGTVWPGRLMGRYHSQWSVRLLQIQ